MGAPLLPQRGAWRGLSPAGRAQRRHTVRACRSTHAHTWMCVRATRAFRGLGFARRGWGPGAGPLFRSEPRPRTRRGVRRDPAGLLGSGPPAQSHVCPPTRPCEPEGGSERRALLGPGAALCCRGHLPGRVQPQSAGERREGRSRECAHPRLPAPVLSREQREGSRALLSPRDAGHRPRDWRKRSREGEREGRGSE